MESTTQSNRINEGLEGEKKVAAAEVLTKRINEGLEVEKNEVAAVGVTKKRRVRNSDLFIRLLALALSLAATLLLGLDKQTKLVPITLVSTLPPLYVPITAKWNQLSAFTFFVVANATACSYSAISLILILGKKRGLSVAIIILDLITVALLASSTGAATAIGVMGYQGNSHVRWNKVCNVFGKYCHQVAAAVVVSLHATLSFLFLVMLAVLDLHKKRY